MLLQVILTGIIILQSVIHYRERRDMYNRLMSKSYTEYSNAKLSPPKHIPSAHDRTLKRWRQKVGDE